MLKWKRQWLETYKMVVTYLKDEGMDAKELGVPFNWIMDLLKTAEKHLKKEEETKKEALGRYESPSGPVLSKEEQKETHKEIEKRKETREFEGYPYDEGAEWGGGPEPEEPNPYHGTYSEE